jgi:hypothetical protein
MPRGPVPEWRKRKEPILDAYINAAISLKPMDDNGAYGTLVYNDVATLAEVKELSNALRRSAYHLKVSVGVRHKEDPDHPGHWAITYTVYDKAHAKAWLIATKGPDRSQWKYDPRKKGSA